jgi:hypothetical protein
MAMYDRRCKNLFMAKYYTRWRACCQLFRKESQEDAIVKVLKFSTAPIMYIGLMRNT